MVCTRLGVRGCPLPLKLRPWREVSVASLFCGHGPGLGPDPLLVVCPVLAVAGVGLGLRRVLDVRVVQQILKQQKGFFRHGLKGLLSHFCGNRVPNLDTRHFCRATRLLRSTILELLQLSVFRIRIILMRIRIRGSASGMMDPDPTKFQFFLLNFFCIKFKTHNDVFLLL